VGLLEQLYLLLEGRGAHRGLAVGRQDATEGQ
jgi:hypothetical protein